MRPDQDLIIKSASLARAAPHAWREFLGSLKNYSADQAVQCVQSPAAELTRMQGRAQQCAELLTLFENAVTTADRIKTPSAVQSATATRR